MRSLLLFLTLVVTIFVKSQTLYWVGGSGNFNDPKHWSLTSNGATANFVPNANTDVVFDNESGSGNLVISLVGINYARAFDFQNDFLPITFTGNKFSELNIHGNFELNNKTAFLTNSKLSFNSAAALYNNVRFNGTPYQGDVVFNAGNWNLKNINIDDNNSISFIAGNYKLLSAVLKAGNFIAKAGTVNFEVKSGVFDVENTFSLGLNTKFTSHNFCIKAKKSDPQKYLVPPGFNFGGNAKVLDAALSAVCGATLSSVGISCSGICDGKLILSIDATCAPPPFDLTWTNPSCPTPTLTGVGPGTYTVSNLCQCADFYSVLVFDGIGNLLTISNSTNIAGQSAISFIPVGFVQPTCFGFCNGSITGNLSGGAPPYTVTVNSGGGGTFVIPTGGSNTTYTNLCSGTNTFAIIDSKGCTKTQTVNLNQPSVLNANSLITNVKCFAACNGSISISPTGGTAGYTVSFTPGGTFTLGAGGTASVTGLCPSAITATVTDNKGCKAIVSGSVTQPPAVTITATSASVTCNAVCNGSASVLVSGGVAPYTYSWNPGGQNTPSVTGLCSGLYTLTVQNNSAACTNTVGFNITQPSSITLTPTVTNITCPGFCTGSATVGASGGTGPKTFTWVAPGNATVSIGSSMSGQCAGIYTVFASDQNSCTASVQVTITAPPAFTLTSATQSITCFNTCTGGATVTVAGGSPPYSYTWSPATASTVAGGTTTASNLCLGNYTVSIRDGSLCTPAPVTLSIQQSPSIIPNITTTSLSCNNVCNGTINSSPTNGVGPYSFTLVTPTSVSITTNPPYSGLCAGNYTLIIKDANCRQSFTTSLAQPNALVASITSNSVSCFNACNGSLSGSVFGGTPGYSLSWATGTTTIAGGVIGGVCANQVYTFSATDANGCVITQTTSITQPTSAITATINQTSPLCNGGICNGALSAMVAGGTPGYTLNWSNGFTGNPNTNLCAGNYTLTVNDANGCIRTFTTVLNAPPAITVTANTASPTCAGSCNGSASVTAIGGTPPFVYQISPFPVNSTGIFTGLCAGSYIIGITDANSCSTSSAVTLNNPPALTPSITGIQSSCNNCGGAATVTPTGGVPGYTVTWVNSGNVTVGTGTTIANLCVGNYTASVKDANNCVATVSVNIVQTVTVSVVAGGTSIQCFGACTGSAVASPAGGTVPYSYTWTPTGPPTQTTQTAVNLCAGNYNVIVSDNLGCTNTATINLVNPPDIIVTSSQTNVSCFSNTTGAIAVNATGGTGPITYAWSPGGQTTPTITGIGAGTYTVTVKDNNNCTKIVTFTITQSNVIAATFTTTQPTGCGINNGSICVTPSGGSGGPYSFTWSPVAGSSSCLTGLGAGVYSLTVSDGTCSTNLSSLLTNPTGPTLSISSNSVACNGGNTGSATVTANGVPSYTFAWTPTVSFVTIGNTSVASSLNTGTYAITVTQGNNCVSTQTISIGTAPAFTVNSVVSNPKCNASCNGSITLVTSGGTPGSAPGYTYAWSSATITGVGTSTVTNLCAGPYTVNITDGNSCVRTQTFNLVNPPPIVLTNTASNVKCFAACNGSISANASGGTTPLFYNWLPVPGIFTGSTTATVLNLCPAIYTVVVTDGNACTATNTINITQPTPLTSTLTSINASCSNSCNATATHVATGGTPGYIFSWSGSISTSSVNTGICAGAYSALITDLNGCTVSKSYTVTAPAPFTGTLVPSSPLCNAICSGSISTTLSGAQGTVSFNWAPTGSGQNPTGLCPNNYTLIATDNAGCKVNAVTTLTNPPAVLANVTFSNPACNSFCNGSAVSSPANTFGTVSYSWSPTSFTTQSISGLCAGNYTLQITDQKGCQDVQTFTLTNPLPLNVNASSSPASCSATNGAISLLVSGGTPTYNFAWNPSVSTSSTASGLGAGIYTIVISDANSCTNTVTIPLSNSNGPNNAPVSTTSINCNGLCTGAASINPASISGGSPGYTISWVSPPSSSTVNPQVNLCAGSYTAQIKDQLSCILFTAVTISQPPPITTNPNVGLPTCNGVCNGSISINTNGGTPPYSYTWSPAAPNSSVITNVCAGIHTVVIGYNPGCSVTQTINVPSIANIAITSATTANVCFGTCAGSASISIANAFPPANIIWSNGQSGSVASALCNGIYTVMVTDGQGCISSATTNITSPSQITALTAINPPLCNLCNGSSTATAAGGTGPYTYSWTSGASVPTASNLCAGLYQVLVTDNAGCSQIINVPISNVPGITGEVFSVINEQCAGTCNGSATVQATGGTAPVTYTWLTNPAVTNSVVSGLCAGNYFVQMADNVGCIRTSSTTISSSPGLTLSPFISPPDCGVTNGTISIVPSGGIGPYTYSWTPSGNITSSLTNVGPGNYTVTVTDSSPNGGCFKVQAFTLSNQNNPTLTYTQTNVSCFGQCTGSIVAAATSTASGAITYSWSNGASTTPTLTNVCPGIITLTAQSSDGCKALQSFTITQNPVLQLSISNVQNVKCFGDCNGQVTLIPSGGILPYTFSWTPGSPGNPQFSLCAGSYSGTVVDSKGCVVTTTAAITGPLSPLAITNTVTNSSCSTAADGSASVTASGGTPSYTYNWSGNPTFTSTSQNLNNVLAGTYSLNATDANGCVRTITLQIVPTITVDARAGRDSVFCTGGSIRLDGSGSIGASGGFNWSTVTNSTSIATTATVNVTPAVGSNTYVLLVVSSASNCVDRDTVVISSLPLPNVDAGPSYTIPVFSTVTIGGNPTAPTGVSFTWSPSFTLNNPNIPNPIASNTLNTTYTIMVTDANGCVSSNTVDVFLYPEIKIPNGFSPNGDGKNDQWIIDNITQFPDCIVEVYNRWGELLFYSTGYTTPFDGRFQGKDLPVGTYYYIINLNHPAYTKPYTGPLTIFR